MLWLAAYLTGFPPVGLHALSWTHGLAPMWSGLYLISTLHLMESTLNGQEHTVSMPSRAYTSFLRYPFKNLGFMRFPEPVFAGIYQNILATAVFRAC